MKPLKDLTKEELQARIAELEESQGEATKHLDGKEVDHPAATAGFGTVGQSDNIRRIPCRNCGFGVASYETKCIACNTPVKST